MGYLFYKITLSDLCAFHDDINIDDPLTCCLGHYYGGITKISDHILFANNCVERCIIMCLWYASLNFQLIFSFFYKKFRSTGTYQNKSAMM